MAWEVLLSETMGWIWMFDEETWRYADAAFMVWEVCLYVLVERTGKELWLLCDSVSVEPYLVLTYPEHLQKFES